jgi:hypothetical protein
MIFSSVIGLGLVMSTTPSVNVNYYEVSNIKYAFNSSHLSELWKENNFMFFDKEIIHDIDMDEEMIDSLRQSDIPELNIEEKLHVSLKESTLPILPVEIDDNLLNLEDH